MEYMANGSDVQTEGKMYVFIDLVFKHLNRFND
jgi:hypothetical protein